MKISVFEAKNTQEAMERVRSELGFDAVILNIKKTKPTGFFSFFRRSSIEITAGLSEFKEIEKPEEPEKSEFEKRQEFLGDELTFAMKEITISEQQSKIDELKKNIKELKTIREEVRKYNSPTVRKYYDELTTKGVLPEVAEAILNEIDLVSDINEVGSSVIGEIVYQSIVSILRGCRAAQTERKILAFVGPTGVGKTTTIAKIAGDSMLNQGKKIGLITSDTYRIAAVEQLKHYGEILGVDVSIAHNESDMADFTADLIRKSDLVLIDTAGRSHKNVENVDELNKMLYAVPENERIVYLVLSLTTKYEDLLSIIDTYSQITDFEIIFTKWDETSQSGTILNIADKIGKPISYICDGQNVPQDISVLSEEKIARALLGLL